MGKGGKDARAATAGKFNTPKAFSSKLTVAADEPDEDKEKQRNRKVKGKALIEYRKPDMGRMRKGEECVAYPREGYKKAIPARVLPPRAIFDDEDLGYNTAPPNPRSILPQVHWRDPSECLEEFVKGSQMPRAVWLGM